MIFKKLAKGFEVVLTRTTKTFTIGKTILTLIDGDFNFIIYKYSYIKN